MTWAKYQHTFPQPCDYETDKLAATRQLDCCELLLVVFLEGRAKLGHERGAFDRERLDIYGRRSETRSTVFRGYAVPAMTSASLEFISNSLKHGYEWAYLSRWRAFHKGGHCS